MVAFKYNEIVKSEPTETWGQYYHDSIRRCYHGMSRVIKNLSWGTATKDTSYVVKMMDDFNFWKHQLEYWKNATNDIDRTR